MRGARCDTPLSCIENYCLIELRTAWARFPFVLEDSYRRMALRTKNEPRLPVRSFAPAGPIPYNSVIFKSSSAIVNPNREDMSDKAHIESGGYEVQVQVDFTTD